MKWFILALLLFWTVPAEAQNEQLWLARYCINEAGFQIDKTFEESSLPHDCSAMERALVNNYRRPRLRTWMMKHYGKKWWRRDRTGRRYIPFLRPVGRAPRGWMRAYWPIYRERFAEVYEFAGRVLSGEARNACEPHHWGAPSLRRRSLRRGWIRAGCGDTVNDFWIVPRRQ
jgi:hypothetical protein